MGTFPEDRTSLCAQACMERPVAGNSQRRGVPGFLLPHGLGRSYGDSCLNADRDLIACRRLNRFLGFDESTGVLRCESGVSLSDILDVIPP